MGSPSGTYRSPLRLFAPQRGPGSHHTSGMQGSTPEQRQETRNPSRSRRHSRTPPPESSSMRIRTETMEVPTTPAPNRHHLPSIPGADPRGPAPNGRTSPPFPRQLSASGRQRFTRAPAGQQTERPAHPPPPSQDRPPTRCQGDNTPRTHGQGSPRPTKGLRKGWGESPPNTPPTRAGRNDTGPGDGHRPPNQLGPCTTGFPSQLQHSQSARARRAHRYNGSTARAAQGRTQK